ncbi:MAG: B12-binding domain-containing radical SAM protein, partial [Thermoplasmatales archaeon]
MVLPVESDFKGTYNVLFGLLPPLGILYLSKILENNDIQVSVLDFSAEKFEDHKLINALSNVDAVGMTIMSTSVQRANEIINKIKEKDQDIPVIIGGPHCTLFPKRSLEETVADICIQGDGENIILNLMKAINSKSDLSKISGIYFREKNSIKKGGKIEYCKNLDTLPFPSRHLVKKYRYGQAYNPRVEKGELTSIITSRGCPYKCIFCSRRTICGNLYRTRSTNNIVEELFEIHNNGYKYIAIVDDSFLSNKKQAMTIFKTVIEENLNFNFYITAARVDSANKELYDLMKKAGVKSIQFGLESGNQEILDYYKKGTTVDKIKYAVNLSNKSGFFTSGTFILGAPFETKKHFDNTVKFAKSLPIEAASFLPLRYRAGTDIWSNAVEKGKIESNEYEVHADSNRRLGLFTEDELKKYCKNAQRIYYLRLAYLLYLLKSTLKKNDSSIFRMLS